jgi:hypothetical protein
MCFPCPVASYNPHVQATACYLCATATQNDQLSALALAVEMLSNNASANDTAGNHTADKFYTVPIVLSRNTTATQASVSVLQCLCDVGQQPFEDASGTRCELCEPGSFKENRNHEKCAYCGAVSTTHGHSLLHHYGASWRGATDTSLCIACPAFSGQDEDLVGPSLLRMSNIEDCMCFRGYERTQDGCRNCSQYMNQPFFSGTGFSIAGGERGKHESVSRGRALWERTHLCQGFFGAAARQPTTGERAGADPSALCMLQRNDYKERARTQARRT